MVALTEATRRTSEVVPASQLPVERTINSAELESVTAEELRAMFSDIGFDVEAEDRWTLSEKGGAA